MTGAANPALASQLLGRIVYFHALLIEPAITDQGPAGVGTGTECCNHDGHDPHQQPAGQPPAGHAVDRAP